MTCKHEYGIAGPAVKTTDDTSRRIRSPAARRFRTLHPWAWTLSRGPQDRGWRDAGARGRGFCEQWAVNSKK